MQPVDVIFSAAGSGGHIYAAVTTYKTFKKNYPAFSKNCLFVGGTLLMENEKHNRTLEERICEHHGIPFAQIRCGKLQRVLNFNTIKQFAITLLGFLDAWKLLRKAKPKVIVAFGGYVTLPLVIVGKFLKIKTIIHEQTSSIGLTNKILQKYADEIVVTFQTSQSYFKKPVTVIGSPTMPYIYSISKFEHLIKYMKKEKSSILNDNAYIEKLRKIEKTNKKRRPVLLISGGSQGSHFLNEQIKELLPKLLVEWNVIIQTGENEYFNDYAKLTDYLSSLPADLSAQCTVRKFLFEEFGYLMKNADLFIGRSGANTVYQLGMNGTPAILIPIAWVTQNEQYTNALILAEAGLAKIIEQATCTPEVLYETIEEMKTNSSTVKPNNIQFAKDADLKLSKIIARLSV